MNLLFIKENIPYFLIIKILIVLLILTFIIPFLMENKKNLVTLFKRYFNRLFTLIKKSIKLPTKIKYIRRFLSVVILLFILLATTVYATSGYISINKLIGESKNLSSQENYDEANKILTSTQNKLLVKFLRIKRPEIHNLIENNKKSIKDKGQYNNAIDELDKNNLQEAINLLSELPESSFYFQKSQTKIEEAKRKIVEGKFSEEQVARKSAEVKAKQEEFEKKLKEQQLAGKEAEEKMMNTDNDSDRLTYRRELELGTSDWNTDSDGDGIPDNLDLHPTGGGRNIPQTFTWSYGGYNWTWTETIQEDWYDYYKAKPREKNPSMVYITNNDPFIKKISERITSGEKGNIYKTWIAVSFVQSLPYVDDVYTGYDEYPKYPVETFFEKNGDCEDTSYLTASILSAMNMASVLILLPSHMAVGVWMDCNVAGTYYKMNDRCYYYIETTGEGWSPGEIPDEYRYIPVTLIKIPSGETISNINPQYKKPCDPSPDFSGYYYDGSNYYSDNQCNYQITCLSYQDYYFNIITKSFYHDSSCSQIAVKGCYKSTNYPGYFYESGSAWYYDSQCKQLYQSMTCIYPSSWNYSCTSEYLYNLKKSNCDYYKSSSYLQSLAENCDSELTKCRNDIDEYQSKLNEYNQCNNKKEY